MQTLSNLPICDGCKELKRWTSTKVTVSVSVDLGTFELPRRECVNKPGKYKNVDKKCKYLLSIMSTAQSPI